MPVPVPVKRIFRAPVHCANTMVAARSLILLRRLSSGVAPCPYAILGIAHGTPKKEVKSRFYALAKQTHPDVATAASTSCEDDLSQSIASGPSFLEIHAAFELIIRTLPQHLINLFWQTLSDMCVCVDCHRGTGRCSQWSHNFHGEWHACADGPEGFCPWRSRARAAGRKWHGWQGGAHGALPG